MSGFSSYEYMLKIHSMNRKNARAYLLQFNYAVKIAK